MLVKTRPSNAAAIAALRSYRENREAIARLNDEIHRAEARRICCRARQRELQEKLSSCGLVTREQPSRVVCVDGTYFSLQWSPFGTVEVSVADDLVNL